MRCRSADEDRARVGLGSGSKGVTHHHCEAGHANPADNEGVWVMLGLARASAAHGTSGCQLSLGFRSGYNGYGSRPEASKDGNCL